MKKNKLNIFLYTFLIIVFTHNYGCSDLENKPDGSSMGFVKDNDGNEYTTVKIGKQVWMAENLKSTRYNDGSEIPNVTGDAEWLDLKTEAYCNYNNLESNGVKYGRLYNWYAVNSGKLAPKGWHVPTDKDWTILENYLIANGYNYDNTKEKNKFAKSIASTSDWYLSTTSGSPGNYLNGNNKSGFNALPGGFRDFNGKCDDVGYGGYWWSTSRAFDICAYFRRLHYNTPDMYRHVYFHNYGISVRCVRD